MTIKEKILKIMSLALEINPPEVENTGQKRTAVFVFWFPHCNNLDINIHYGSWWRGVSADERISIRINRENASESLDAAIEKLETIKKYLEGSNE